jgi:hypothetical protein
MALSVAVDRRPPAARPEADRELGLVCAAVNLVATGEACRVTHVGLRFAQIVADAQAYGREQGVIVRCRWRAPGAGCDIIVEPIG